MSVLDTLSSANKKNSINKSRLAKELHQLEVQEKEEIRMFNTVKQRFKAKYLKLNCNSGRKSNHASDVRMYETHNPGFCYRRNGECRLPPSSTPCPCVDFEDLHTLLFTDGEVDVEKVVCLHLFTAHSAESLTPPPKSHKSIKFLSKDQSPLERLIERSKKKHPEPIFAKLLPTYILDVKPPILKTESKVGGKIDGSTSERDSSETTVSLTSESTLGTMKTDVRLATISESSNIDHSDLSKIFEQNSPSKSYQYEALRSDSSRLEKKSLIEDGRLVARNIINDKIVQLVCTVLSALKKSNPEKLEELLMVAKDPIALRKIIRKPRIQDFMQSLQGQTLVCSCESFYLSSPFKTTALTLEIPGPTGSLEILLNYIRRNVFRNPGQIPRKFDFTPIIDVSEDNASRKSMHSKTSFRQRSEDSSIKYLDKWLRNDEYGIDSDLFSVDCSSGRSSSKETVRQVLVEPRSYAKKFAVDTLAELLSKKASAAFKRDLACVNYYTYEEDTTKKEEVQEDTTPVKISLKQTTCPACMERWKSETPVPKAPHLRKAHIPSLTKDNYNEITTSSTHRLSLLIDKEMDKMKMKKNRPLTQKGNSILGKRKKDWAGEMKIEKLFMDTVELNDLDLAKIRQEIKVKETSKKLKMFLDNPI